MACRGSRRRKRKGELRTVRIHSDNRGSIAGNRESGTSTEFRGSSGGNDKVATNVSHLQNDA